MRGIAALCVVIYHFDGGFGLLGLPTWFIKTPFSFFTDGMAAVSLFFVLSGFVLTFKAFSAPEDYSIKKSLPVFLIHRVMRIMPPFIFWLIVSALSAKYLAPLIHDFPGQSTWLRTTWADPVTLKRVLREMIIIVPPFNAHLIPQDWSLTYEMNISLFIPLYTWLGVAGNFPFYFYLVLRSSKNLFLFQFFLGMIISKHFRSIQNKVTEMGQVKTLIAGLVALTLYNFRNIFGNVISSHFSLERSETLITIANAVGAAFVIAIAIGSPKFQKFLNHKLLLWLGQISYSLYLLHIVVIKCFSPLVMNRLVNINSLIAGWAGLGITVIATLILAQISYSLIERPSIALGKTLGIKMAQCAPWLNGINLLILKAFTLS